MKPKIISMGSEEYQRGRIDYFEIDEENGGFNAIVSCLEEFGFNKEDVRWEIDGALEDRGYVFLYLNEKLRVHLSAEKSKNSFIIRLDTSLSRKNITDIFLKYFKLWNT